MEAFGATPEAIEAAVAPEREKATFEVHADNEWTVSTFLALQTQWRVAVGMGGVAHLGLDYAAIPPTMALLGVPRTQRREVFDGLRVMEAAALPILNAPKESPDAR